MRVHPDNHALWIDPQHPEHMMLGNDGGVFFTYNGARHWDYDNNLPIGQLYGIAVDSRDPYWVYGGLQDLGTFMFASGTHSRGALTKDQATFLEYGDGFQVAVDPTNPRLVYTQFAERARLRGRSRHARGAPHYARSADSTPALPVQLEYRNSPFSERSARILLRRQQAAEDHRLRHHVEGDQPGPHD